MTVYVDDMQMQARVGRINGRWSHLFTDQDDQTELHELAQRIGLMRSWFQHPECEADSPWRCHYDVTEIKRRAALAAGAVPITWSESGRMTHERSRAQRAQQT